MIYVLSLKASNCKSLAAAIDYLGFSLELISPADIVSIKRNSVVFIPGVGHMRSLYNELKINDGIRRLQDYHSELNLTYVGICLGFQVMCQSSTEANDLELLSLFPSSVLAIDSPPVPNVGWYEIFFDFPTSFNISNELASSKFSSFYFTHSYSARYQEVFSKQSEAKFDMILYRDSLQRKIVAGIIAERLYGFQFHPEKSGNTGLHLLDNVIRQCL